MGGDGAHFRAGEIYWVARSHRGREHRESAKSTRESDACELLKKRLGEIVQGRLIGPTEERVTFEDLAADYLRDYGIKGLRSSSWAKARVAHLRRCFGMDRAPDITTARVRAYIQARPEEGATPPRSTGTSRPWGACSLWPPRPGGSVRAPTFRGSRRPHPARASWSFPSTWPSARTCLRTIRTRLTSAITPGGGAGKSPA